ncbi:alpha-tocopherol transfer protein-like [Panonychus citri]|uniref:alpha-tocopherol transfer protein-like n=1 Tax=Panonychus citri TaxID=50023 RepID=UPI0023080CD0|nr:alpha-tocopherol transfer protein-like [Panonychus citri]
MENELTEKVEQLRAELTKIGIRPLVDQPEYLIKFLRARSSDVTSTVTLMKSYLDYKGANPNIFNLPYRLKPVFDANVMRLLDTRSKVGEALVLFKPGYWNPSSFNFDGLLSAALITFEQAALDSETQKAGVLLISDMDSFGWKQLKHFGPMAAKKLATVLEKVVPTRVNGVMIFNQSRIAEMAWAVIRPFLSEHLRSRVTFHGSDYQYLEQTIQDPTLLPATLGGQVALLECSDLYRNLANNENLYKSFGYN